MKHQDYFEQGRRAGYFGEPRPAGPALAGSWQQRQRAMGWVAGQQQRQAERAWHLMAVARQNK